jgi:hypothetical protein
LDCCGRKNTSRRLVEAEGDRSHLLFTKKKLFSSREEGRIFVEERQMENKEG